MKFNVTNITFPKFTSPQQTTKLLIQEKTFRTHLNIKSTIYFPLFTIKLNTIFSYALNHIHRSHVTCLPSTGGHNMFTGRVFGT